MPDWSRLLHSLFVVLGFASATDASAVRAAAPDSCAALAQFGSYDTNPATSDGDRADSFRNWLCQANISLESDLRVAAPALGIPPDLIEATFGFDATGSADFLNWKHGLCATIRSDQATADRFAAFVKGLTPATAAALAACEATPGLHARLETTAKQCEFRVHLAWTPDKDASSPLAAPTDVQVIATNPHLTCTPNALQTPFAVNGPTDVTCMRHDDTAMVLMLEAPSANVTRLDHLMELPQALPDPQDALGGDYQVEIAWRDRSGRYGPSTSDVWHLDLSNGACRITSSGTAHTPRSAWFTQARADCTPIQIDVTGYRSFDPAVGKPTQFSLSLHSDDQGATFTGSGQDSLGGVAVQATLRHRAAATPTPDQTVCKP